MKSFLSLLIIGILLACIYYSLGAEKTSPFTITPPYPKFSVNKNDGSVKLFNFQGSLNGNKIKLRWMVEENQKVNQFEIEKSADGKNFKMAALIFGTDKGDTDNYMFYEKASDKKMSYRIKIINNNGAISYSDIIEVGPEYSNNNNVAFQNQQTQL